MDDSAVLSLRQRVDQEIASSSGEILDRVVGHYVEAERDRRSKLIIAAVNTLREIETDLRKVGRGDVVHYDAAGAVVNEVYTKARLGEIKKLNERRTKLDFALKKALGAAATNDDFAKLEKATKSKGGNQPKGGDEEEDEDE